MKTVKRFLAILLFVSLPAIVVAQDAPEDYRLIASSGDVAVIPAGSQEPQAARAGLPLAEGDRVVTGPSGSAELAAKSGTVIRLENNSSLGLESLRSGWSIFRLTIGRFLGKFQHTPDSHYSVRTPVAVASVRGTEFALDVAENGELNAGVVEGEVAVTAPDEAPATAPGADSARESGAAWKEEVLGASQGLAVRPLEQPRRLSEIPRPLVRSLDWFPRIRERIPKLREQWKDLPPLERERLRRESLRERVQWRVPGRPAENVQPLRERIPRVPVERRRLPRPGRIRR